MGPRGATRLTAMITAISATPIVLAAFAIPSRSSTSNNLVRGPSSAVDHGRLRQSAMRASRGGHELGEIFAALLALEALTDGYEEGRCQEC